MMKTIFVADDNALTLDALRSSSLWEEWGYQLVGQADNGISALEQIRTLKPDMAILDIRMPGMTGLDVIRELRKEETECLFVMLTAYDEFTFAREGLQLGVFDYLLKPLNEEEMKSVLNRGAKIIHQKYEERILQEKAQRDFNEGSELELRRKLLADSLNGSRQALQELEMMEKEASAAYVIMKLNRTGTLPDVETSVDVYLNRITEILTETEEKHRCGILHTWDKGGMILLISFPGQNTTAEYQLLSLKIAGYIVDRARDQGFLCAVGISRHRKNLEQLADMSEEAGFAVNGRFFLENQSVVHYSSMLSNSVKNEYALARNMHELNQIMVREPKKVPEKAKELLERLSETAGSDVEYVRNIAYQIAMSFFYASCEKNPKLADRENVTHIGEQIRRQATMQNLIEWMGNFFREMMDQTQESGGEVSGQTKLVLDFLNAHYMDKISLGEAAEYAGISESHLCRILKNDLGETFVTILNKIRIQAAIRLLQEGRYKVYEIAEKVGFSNYAYFYQLFRKTTGYPPTDYH